MGNDQERYKIIEKIADKTATPDDKARLHTLTVERIQLMSNRPRPDGVNMSGFEKKAGKPFYVRLWHQLTLRFCLFLVFGFGTICSLFFPFVALKAFKKAFDEVKLEDLT